MMKTAKGTQDFSQGEMRHRQYITDKLREIFELYGYEPLDTPILELQETLTSKYAGGEEIIKEIFTLQDQGKRKLGLRYDLTVPLCRFMAMNPNLKLPFKRYHIAPVFRDGPIKAGRSRQFVQCDADIAGVEAVSAEIELLQMALGIFKKLELPSIIKINSRKILDGLLDSADIKKTERTSTILSLDKLEKIGEKGVVKELKEKKIANGEKLLKLFSVKDSNQEKIAFIEKNITTQEGKEGIADIKEVLSKVKDKAILFEPSLARGLAYYTGIVFEAFLINGKITSSISAGGRYDNVIGNFLGSKQKYPAVGISFGLDVLMNAMKKEVKNTTKVFVIPIKTAVTDIVATLRKENIPTDTDLIGRGITKNLNFVNAKQIPYAMIIGQKENEQKKVTLRNMETGKEKLLTLKDAIKLLR